MEQMRITSGILQQAVDIKKVNKKEATHFALCNGDNLRYLIALNGGKQRLSRNIATYSGKLILLMRLLNYLPFCVMKIAKLGYFVRVRLHPIIETQYEQLGCDAYNIIVGTYDEKQKLVLQCFKILESLATFIKIGNGVTKTEMEKEIGFLREKHSYKTFILPELVGAELADRSNTFNIQITREFVGDKIAPGITEEIIRIYQEIASAKQTIDGTAYEFSHGDFAPWNIKKSISGYVVFDWEHCGFRMRGFDLMHYAVIPKVTLEKKDLSTAYKESLSEIQKVLPAFSMEQLQFEKEYKKLRLE